MFKFYNEKPIYYHYITSLVPPYLLSVKRYLVQYIAGGRNPEKMTELMFFCNP